MVYTKTNEWGSSYNFIHSTYQLLYLFQTADYPIDEIPK